MEALRVGEQRMKIDGNIRPGHLAEGLERFFSVAGRKVCRLVEAWNPADGAPVFTRRGKYTSRGWTEWTQGFLYGMPLLHFDATGDLRALELGREMTLRHMAPHLTHTGVHDHGFNNISTYGNLWRLAKAGRTGDSADLVQLYEMALRVSGAVQAARWTEAPAAGGGYIYSFNGPHSLFSDTIRSCRSLVLAHRLGHVLCGENDRRISLLGRAMDHIRMTLRYNVYYGTGRDAFDVRGRVAHEGIFNVTDGNYRCPSTQQGYSPFSTWTRGLAWILLGCAEELEVLVALPKDKTEAYDPGGTFVFQLIEAARATADFYIANTAADGIPFWDTGAPGVARAGDYQESLSNPANPWEPVDSSAACIAAQGLLRLGNFLGRTGKGARYFRAGLVTAKTLLNPPYLSVNPRHDGLILHSVYHRPNGWDYVPKGKLVPQGESCMWGDYHAMEMAVYLRRLVEGRAAFTFCDQ
jgi:unsaturated chondroitin disaccharide hydrolase